MVIQGFTWIFLLIVLLANRAVCDGDDGGRPRELPERDPQSRFRCVNIPDSIGFCSGIGYTQMRLPNMFNQDTIADVENQTKTWIPLVRQNCHREIQRFLCFSFAPVCVLQKPNVLINPCQSLCYSVMRPCSAVMEVFGFSWPANLDCTQFPPDTDQMCIRSEKDPNCDTCPSQDRVTYESIIGQYCVNKFVVMASIENVRQESNIIEFELKRSNLKFLKLIAPDKRKINKVVMETPSGCHCSALLAAKSDPSKIFLLMGTVNLAGIMQLSHIIEWQPSNPAFKRAMSKIEDGKKRRDESVICKLDAVTDSPPSQLGDDAADRRT